MAVVKGSMVTDAILDLLFHNSYRFELKGPTKRGVETGEQKANIGSRSHEGTGAARPWCVAQHLASNKICAAIIEAAAGYCLNA